MDPLRALALSSAEYRRRVAQVRPEDLDAPSRCPGWSVRDLVNHVAGGGHRYLLLLRGGGEAELAPTRTQDHVGADPLAGWLEWDEPLAAAFREPGAWERVVAHRAGDQTGLELLRMRVLEQTLHAWDLAVSLDFPADIDAGLAEHILAECLGAVEHLAAAGYYAPPSAPAADDPLTRLLAATGRA